MVNYFKNCLLNLKVFPCKTGIDNIFTRIDRYCQQFFAQKFTELPSIEGIYKALHSNTVIADQDDCKILTLEYADENWLERKSMLD